LGRDAYVHINKKYTKESIEKLLILMGYKKYGQVFFSGDDKDYKYLSGIKVWQCDENDEEYILRVRTQAFASSYDIFEQNNTIRNLKKYCCAWFVSDMGQNRYFDEVPLVKGAESGCYFALQKLDNNFSLLRHSLSKYPDDEEGEKCMMEMGDIPTTSIFNANVYSSFLCSLIEEYFKATYITLLRYSDRKEKILNVKFSPFDMKDISEGSKTVEEVYASTLSFQNIQKIVLNFSGLDSKLDIGIPLKKPYHRRKKSLYLQINEILERRHGMIHRMDFDFAYNSVMLSKDIEDVKIALKRVYSYICQRYGWEEEDVTI
jgi:hypothetical protein